MSDLRFFDSEIQSSEFDSQGRATRVHCSAIWNGFISTDGGMPTLLLTKIVGVRWMHSPSSVGLWRRQEDLFVYWNPYPHPNIENPKTDKELIVTLISVTMCSLIFLSVTSYLSALRPFETGSIPLAVQPLASHWLSCTQSQKPIYLFCCSCLDHFIRSVLTLGYMDGIIEFPFTFLQCGELSASFIHVGYMKRISFH